MTLIAQLADIHFGAEDAQALDTAKAVIADAGVAQVLICGDLTQRGRRSEFTAARNWLDGLEIPYLTVPGNHDLPLLGWWQRLMGPFKRYDDFFADRAPPTSADGWHVAGLNTARGWQARRNWAEGSVDLDDLDQVLRHHEERDPGISVLMTHHPMIAAPDAPMRVATRRGRRASRAIAESRVDMLLCGHVHEPSVQELTGDTGRYFSVTAGTLSQRRRGVPSSFNLMSCEGSKVSIETIWIEGHQHRLENLLAFEREPEAGSAVDRSSERKGEQYA